ncbi:hypothetical protein TCON_1791 [Astathelohania contejeani]|uniref:Uncharacterized protein n=1 Tax=Astathelohania contejeani TaxID=164912 RepID=A0ABQ7HXU3_9MICR|nr:hypothetical protein TCON_1791 [Thelohania contejeani]
MLGHDYTRRHNEVLRCIHLLLANKYGFKKSKKLQIHLVQEVMENERAEIRVDTRIRTDILIKNNRPDIFIYDKKQNEIILVEVGITSQDNLQIVKIKKKKKYELLTNELGLLHKTKTKIMPHAMTLDGVVTKYHKKYFKELNLTPTIEAYIQSTVLKKTLETISLEYRRSIEDSIDVRDRVEDAVKRFGKAIAH